MTVTVDVSSGVSGGSTSPITWAHTIAAESDRLTVGFLVRDNAAAPSVTWNGSAMHHVNGDISSDTGIDVWEMYKADLDSVGRGTHNISITWTTGGRATGVGVSFLGSHPTLPLSGWGFTRYAGTTSPSINIVSSPAALVIGMLATRAGDAITPGADENELQDILNAGAPNLRGWLGWQQGALSVTLSPTWATSAAASIAGFSIPPKAAGNQVMWWY